MTASGLALDPGLLPRLARAMTASWGLGDVPAAASRAAVELVPDSFVLVWVLHGDRLVLRGAAGVLDDAHSGLRTDLALGEGLPGLGARHRQPLVVAADRARAMSFTWTATAAGRSHVQEYRMSAADGREVWVRDSASLVREAAGRRSLFAGVLGRGAPLWTGALFWQKIP
jgi:hypothetical protein